MSHHFVYLLKKFTPGRKGAVFSLRLRALARK
jgi:hypothetical protein